MWNYCPEGLYGIESAQRRTVRAWKRAFIHDAAMEPKAPRSTELTPQEEPIVVAFRVTALRASSHKAGP
jgi:hypothetical protein